MDKSTIQKPITVLREEFIDGFLNFCNSSGLPFFVIEDILKLLISEIHSAAIKQYQSDKEKYELMRKQMDSATESIDKGGA